MNKPEKKHDTGLRILEVLKILLEKNLSKTELIEKLKENDLVENVYSQEAFLKYFNTFELSGLKLNRFQGKYSLNNALLKINLSKKEQEMLILLINSITKLNNKSEEEIMRNFFLKINKYINIDLNNELDNIINKETSIQNSNIRNNIIETLKHLIYEEQKVNITYKKTDNTEETDTFELKEIIENDNCIYVVCYSPLLGRNKKININSIKSLNQLPQKISGVCYLNSIVFEVYGRLASLYRLKPSEKVIDFSNNHLTISNTEEDKDSLLLRLLKYGENCKIIRPKSLQEEFINLTNDILKNLEAS
ncbi:TPA: WYL domain-containing protein [Candidatus Avigastranaerophilus faecigallinarum]|nr:WYL domain-containing protein [Candidatus Avigastranaerophilus faecigallinarum]